MFTPKRILSYMSLIRIGIILLMMVLIGFGIAQFNTINDINAINQAALQRTRDEVFAKSAYTLRYGAASEKAQAINSMQVSLPLFEKEQVILTDSTVPDVQVIMQDVRSDYLALDAAVKSIVAQPDKAVDPIEVDIILAHEQVYLTKANSVVVVLSKYSQAQAVQLCFIQWTIEVATIIFSILLIVLDRHLSRIVAMKIEKQQILLDIFIGCTQQVPWLPLWEARELASAGHSIPPT